MEKATGGIILTVYRQKEAEGFYDKQWLYIEDTKDLLEEC